MGADIDQMIVKDKDELCGKESYIYEENNVVRPAFLTLIFTKDLMNFLVNRN